jgi:acetyltransferase
MTHNVYEGNWTLADGEKLTIRHTAPADAEREQTFVQELSRESSYRRFHGTKKDLGMKELKEFTQPDKRNAVAIIVLVSTEKGEEEIGEARYVINPEWTNGEFAIVVADKWQKRGIGTRLMNALITHLKVCGVEQISGSVIKSNMAMRKLMKQMGFEEINDPDDPSTLIVRKKI